MEEPVLQDQRYRVVSLLGKGGMGVVYRARDLELGRDVAVKVLDSEIASQIQLTRFQRESQYLARLSHPQIVRIYDVSISPPAPYLVMELLDGVPLASVIGAPLPEREACLLLIGLLQGLSHVHQEGLLHRDLKPSNVIITEDRGPVLIDFGLAREQEGGTVLTKAGELLGTPRYLAPELLKGEPATRVTDVFAAGLIGLEALTGSCVYAPLPDGRPAPLPAVLSDLASQTYYRRAARLLEERGRLGKQLLRALAPEPGDRYACAGSFLEDVRTCHRSHESRQVRELARQLIALDAERRAAATVPGSTATRALTAPLGAADRLKRQRPADAARSTGRPWLVVVTIAVTIALGARLRTGSAPRSGSTVSPATCAGLAVTSSNRGALGSPPGSSPRVRDSAVHGLARRLQSWTSDPAVSREVRRLRKVARRPPDERLLASQVSALLTTCGIQVGGPPPVETLLASHDPLEERVYWELILRLGVARLAWTNAGRSLDLSRLFPEWIRPGSLPPRTARTFERPFVGAPALTNNTSLVVLESLARSHTRGLVLRLDWEMTIDRLGPAVRAWALLKVRKTHRHDVVKLAINGRLSVALVTPPGAAASQTLTHSIPSWCLRNGRNTFCATVESFVMDWKNLDGLEWFRIVTADG